MAEHEPTSADAIAGDSTERAEPMGWSEAREVIAETQMYFVATIGPGGAPHVRPVLGVWVDGALVTRPRARRLARPATSTPTGDAR